MKGSGNGELVYGNCWDAGQVQVYMNTVQISSADAQTRHTISFPYTNGDTLSVSDAVGNSRG